MTRKDYELIAGVIKNSCDIKTNQTAQRIAQGFCTVLRADNNRFDDTRFLKACGMTN